MTLSAKRKMLSYLLKAVVVIAAVVGTAMSAYAGSQSFMGGSRVFMYFTIQSNIAVALMSAVGAALMLRARRIAGTWYVIKLVGTVAITLTGVVFCFVLAPTLGAEAWNVQNVLTHVVVPVAAIADFFVTGVDSDIRKRSVIFVAIPPLLYAVYAGIGYGLKWEFAPGVYFPYFFLNWGSPAGAFGFSDRLPFMGCVWWILALLILLMLTGSLYLAILNRMKRHRVADKKIG
ncbi:MAG: Pr6Pr family membrane protein [Clostridia bacterium]|nr:Pr6Pr family membrane protein [Clostridia bacterium]